MLLQRGYLPLPFQVSINTHVRSKEDFFRLYGSRENKGFRILIEMSDMPSQNDSILNNFGYLGYEQMLQPLLAFDWSTPWYMKAWARGGYGADRGRGGGAGAAQLLP